MSRVLYAQPSEIEYNVLPSESRVTFRDNLSKGGPLFYGNNDCLDFLSNKIGTLDVIPNNSEPEILLRREKQIKASKLSKGGRLMVGVQPCINHRSAYIHLALSYN